MSILSPLLLLTLCIAGGCCAPAGGGGASHQTTTQAPTAQRLSAEQAGPRVAAAIEHGDYAAAASLTAQTDLSRAELAHALGHIMLDAQVDPAAKTRPKGSVEDAMQQIETAALLGLTDAATSLRALFSTGLSNRGANPLLAPNPALEQCWAAVEAGTAAALHCVEGRRGTSH